MTSSEQISLKSKTHFEILDGLRGVAAIGVVIFHFMEMFISDFTKIFIAHGYLAVDFFFCLSGFVIAYAYDDRVEKMGLTNFFKVRLIRLHPLVVLGAILGLLAFVFDPFATTGINYSWWQLTIIFLASIFLIPYPIMPERVFNLFGLNAPAWSLFWEYVGNIVYALVLYRLKRIWLLIAAIAAAIWLFYLGKTVGNVNGGWNGATFWEGGARMAFSFLAGMCIFRYQLIFRNNLGFPALCLLLLAALISPFNQSYNWILEPAIIVFYFPLLVSLGAGAALNPKHINACKFSGQISYPLYITHYFALWTFGNYYVKYQPNAETLAIVIPAAILVQLFVAYLAMKYYDLPIRRRLMK